MKEIWLFGNPDLPEDSLPIRLRERLSSRFPAIRFVVKDPLEEWELPPELLIIDTVDGLNEVRELHSPDEFTQERRSTLHDFDLGMQLQLLKKTGQLPPLTIWGVPPRLAEDDAFQQLEKMLVQRFPDA